jgi:uncharacterized membrane protein
VASFHVDSIASRVREREVKRQLRFNEARKRVILARERFPALGREFLETLLGSALGFFVLAWLLSRFAGVGSLYTLSAFGFVYSSQATYYKRRLARDPDFRIPSCKCAGRRTDGTEGVLRSRQSAVLGIPNSVFASGFFCAVLGLTAFGESRLALPLAVGAVAASVYLGYVMLTRLRSLCSICINIAALNALVLWQLLV